MLQDFFEWLLDPTHFPNLVPNSRKRLLPAIRREIQHLQKLQRQMSSSLQEAITCLERHEGMVATELHQYSSRIKSRASPVKGNIEETEHLFLATQVARLLKPNESPHFLVIEHLRKNNYHRDERTIEARVRRFEKQLGLDGCRQVAESQYGIFKKFRLWPRLEPLMRPGLWEKNCLKLARRLGISNFETRLLQKLCESDGRTLKFRPADRSMRQRP
jgi:hypothetical protein